MAMKMMMLSMLNLVKFYDLNEEEEQNPLRDSGIIANEFQFQFRTTLTDSRRFCSYQLSIYKSHHAKEKTKRIWFHAVSFEHYGHFTDFSAYGKGVYVKIEC